MGMIQLILVLLSTTGYPACRVDRRTECESSIQAFKHRQGVAGRELGRCRQQWLIGNIKY